MFSPSGVLFMLKKERECVCISPLGNLVLLKVKSPRYVIIVRSSLPPQWLTSLVSRAHRTIDLLRDRYQSKRGCHLRYLYMEVRNWSTSCPRHNGLSLNKVYLSTER